MRTLSANRQRWLLEWCSGIPLNEFGDGDLNRAIYVREPFDSLEAAKMRAVQLIANEWDAFGCVRLQRQAIAVDEDILEHEGRAVVGWRDIGEALHLSDTSGKAEEE